MDWLEEELRKALARKEPPPDFAARVRAAARPRPIFARRWLSAAAALLVIAGGAGGLAWRHHRGMVAKRQVMLALQISAAKLQRIQAHLREVNQ
jgi:hypothetical protein